MEELEYTIKQTQRAIGVELKNIIEAVNDLQAKIASGDWENVDTASWVDGYVARDVARVSASLAQQQALINALYMVKQGKI